MSGSRTKGRRSSSRAFRPALDGQLEDRVLLSQTLHQYLGTQPWAAQAPPGRRCVSREHTAISCVECSAVQSPFPGDSRRRDPDDPRRPGRQRGCRGWFALPDPARLHPQHRSNLRPGWPRGVLHPDPCFLTHSAAFTSPTGWHRPGLCHAEWRGRYHRGWLDREHRADDQRAAASDSPRGMRIAMRTA